VLAPCRHPAGVPNRVLDRDVPASSWLTRILALGEGFDLHAGEAERRSTNGVWLIARPVPPSGADPARRERRRPSPPGCRQRHRDRRGRRSRRVRATADRPRRNHAAVSAARSAGENRGRTCASRPRPVLGLGPAFGARRSAEGPGGVASEFQRLHVPRFLFL
jgi:hypothetical protein